MAYATPPMANAVRLLGRLVAELVGVLGVQVVVLPQPLLLMNVLRL